VVNDPQVVALRRKVRATVDTAIAEDQADVRAVLRDGRELHLFIEHAIGSVDRPMSDAALEAKFHGQADPVLGAPRVQALIQACWGLGGASGVGAVVQAAGA
jgi:2-methylcitrate dehydratase PrpD